MLRPIARLAASISSHDLHLMIWKGFLELDADGLWIREIEELGSELGVTPWIYESPFDCIRQLGPADGMILAGSESDAKAHLGAHELFRAVPGRYRTVTLQHGFECVGFLHNARHDATSGRDVRFAADIAVSWFDVSQSRSVSTAEASKIYVAGPSTMIERSKRALEGGTGRPGLICENLHSVRFANGRVRQDFVDTFLALAERLRMLGRILVLRPHPAGRFSERKGIPLPDNVEVSRTPLYRMNLADFGYAISAPSTILFDFAVAGIPVATWIDAEGQVDFSNFAALSRVATLEDWWRFHWAAQWERGVLVERQDRFLDGLAIPTDVRGRYQALLAAA